MSTWTRVFLAVVIGAAVGAVLGAAAGFLRNQDLGFQGGLLVAASGGISAGVVVAVLRPKAKR